MLIQREEKSNVDVSESVKYVPRKHFPPKPAAVWESLFRLIITELPMHMATRQDVAQEMKGETKQQPI